MVWYTNVDLHDNFLAVYTGVTLAEARRFLKQVEAKGFRDAIMRRMQVVVDISH
jgi:(2Fe-2S) ferredoxin